MRTLWEAIEQQRPSWRRFTQRLRHAPIPPAHAAVLMFLSCVAVIGYTAQLALPSLSSPLPGWMSAIPHLAAASLAAVLAVSLLRLVRPQRDHGAVLSSIEPFTVTPPVTSLAWNSVSLASELTSQNVLRLKADGVNAALVDIGSSCAVAVTEAFTRLPADEQEAGFAILLGRARVLTSSGTLVVSDGDPVTTWPGSDPYRQEAVYAAWVESAVEGDREALLLTRDPAPLLRLLNRLSRSDNAVPGMDVVGAFQCLSWPFPPLVTGEQLRSVTAADAMRIGYLNEVLPAGEMGALRAQVDKAVAE